MLDVPNFFWESEPTLHPLYSAVREYMEIKPRIQVLNERCRVFLDLAEILSDSVADRKMSCEFFAMSCHESFANLHSTDLDHHCPIGNQHCYYHVRSVSPLCDPFIWKGKAVTSSARHPDV